MIEYEDFSIRIEPQRGDRYPVTVLRSPAGEGRSSFRLPFDLAQVGDLLLHLGRSVRGSGEVELRHARPGSRTSPQEVGEQLFSALFSGSTRSLLDQSLGMIHGRNLGLRIKLHIDAEDPGLAQLASLPWELLYRKETREFLNLSSHTPLVRYLDVQRPHTPLPLEPPLRILIVISSPADCRQLDLDKERALIERGWGRYEGVQVDFVEEATVLALQGKLAARLYHVLHYMGHGDFDEQSGQGMLLMEDAHGQASPVDGESLGILLRDARTLRLVFLNACETAKVTREHGLDPFAGVASALVLAGIPAVVAMQFPISDRAAITYAGTFYPLLAQGFPVDQAAAEGRRAIRLSRRGTMEWATPVLFMRAPDGVLFAVSEGQRERRTPPKPLELDEDLGPRLERLYTAGLSALWLEEWDGAIYNFQAVVDLCPDYQGAAARLAEAEKQKRLASLYGRAQAARQAGDLGGALAALEELIAEEPGYRDAGSLLASMRHQQQLADLYAEAQQLHGAGQWRAVIAVFDQIQTLDPEYRDPEGLLLGSQRELEVERRRAQAEELYGRALRAMDAGDFREARNLLGQVLGLAPGRENAQALLERVKREIARQAQVDDLYGRALRATDAGDFLEARDLLGQVLELAPDWENAQVLLERVKRETARRETAPQRVELLRPKRRIPRWQLLATVGGSVTIVVVAVLILSGVFGGDAGGPASSTPSAAAVAEVAGVPSSIVPPTDTPSPSPTHSLTASPTHYASTTPTPKETDTPSPTVWEATYFPATVASTGGLELTLRQAPRVNAPVVEHLEEGTALLVWGRDSGGGWLRVSTPADSAYGELGGWVSASFVDIDVEIEELPVFPTGTDSPTETPSPTATETPHPVQPTRLQPLSDALLQGVVEFRWSYPGELAPDEAFQVLVWKDGALPPYLGAADVTRELKQMIDLDAIDNTLEAGDYRWSVVVVDAETAEPKTSPEPGREFWYPGRPTAKPGCEETSCDTDCYYEDHGGICPVICVYCCAGCQNKP